MAWGPLGPGGAFGLTGTSAGRGVGVRADAAGRLSGEGDAVGVAAQGRDVLLHPAQGELLVLEPPVAGAGPVPRAEEAERAEAVVERDQHQVAVQQVLRAVERRATLAEAARVQPHQHGQVAAVDRLRKSRQARPDYRRLLAKGKSWTLIGRPSSVPVS